MKLEPFCIVKGQAKSEKEVEVGSEVAEEKEELGPRIRRREAVPEEAEEEGGREAAEESEGFH